MAERGEDFAGRARAEGHFSADDRDDGNIIRNFNAVGLDFRANFVHNGIEMCGELFRGHGQRDAVDARGRVADGHAVFLHDAEDRAQRAGGAGQPLLGYSDDRKVLLARDAGDEALRVRRLNEVVGDERTGMAGIVGIADVQGNVLLAHGENGHLVQHLCAGIGELTKLGIGRAVDGLGMIDDARVGHEHTGNIRPVLIHRGVQRGCRQRARDVRAAARERAHLAVGHQTIKAGDDDLFASGQRAQRGIGFFLINRAVIVKVEPACRIDKFKAEIFRH